MVTDALERKKRLGAERKYLEQYWEQDLEQNSYHWMKMTTWKMQLIFY